MTDDHDVIPLYIETLTRAELAWVSSVGHDGRRSYASRTNKAAAQVAVDALIDAGLLPKGVEP